MCVCVYVRAMKEIKKLLQYKMATPLRKQKSDTGLKISRAVTRGWIISATGVTRDAVYNIYRYLRNIYNVYARASKFGLGRRLCEILPVQWNRRNRMEK